VLPMRGPISCLLCKGAISVRSGNLDKFKVHVESAHDVFYDHDILIAINFLEAHEKEVIIEKVLPRMKLLFDNVRSFNGKFVIGSKLTIEKRLLEHDEDPKVASDHPAKKARQDDDEDIVDINEVMDSSIELSDVNDEINVGDDSDGGERSIQQISDDEDSETENDAVSVGETLAESIQSIRDILKDKKDTEDEFTTCDICSQSIRKSIYDFHRKSHLSAAKTTAECDICRKVMQKKSMYKHKRRCEIMNMSRNNSGLGDPVEKDSSLKASSTETDFEEEVDASKIADIGVVSKSSTSEGESQCYICKKPMLKGNIRRHIRMVHTAELDFKCKICFTGFQKLDSLRWHTNKEHNLDLEDVEQMLQESSEQKSKYVEKETSVQNEPTSGNIKLDPEILEKMKSTENDVTTDKPEDGGESKKYKCDQCENVYTNKDSVRRHRRKAHPQQI